MHMRLCHPHYTAMTLAVGKAEHDRHPELVTPLGLLFSGVQAHSCGCGLYLSLLNTYMVSPGLPGVQGFCESSPKGESTELSSGCVAFVTHPCHERTFLPTPAKGRRGPAQAEDRPELHQ